MRNIVITFNSSNNMKCKCEGTYAAITSSSPSLTPAQKQKVVLIISYIKINVGKKNTLSSILHRNLNNV